MDDETPEWVKVAMDVDGVRYEPVPVKIKSPRCPSCGQQDDCTHGLYEMRANGSYICNKCDRLLHGQPTKEEQRCAECGRSWE